MQKFLCQNNTLKVKKELCGDFSEYRISVTWIYTKHHNSWFYEVRKTHQQNVMDFFSIMTQSERQELSLCMESTWHILGSKLNKIK